MIPEIITPRAAGDHFFLNPAEYSKGSGISKHFVNHSGRKPKGVRPIEKKRKIP
jgi:hypothetical protein